MTYITLTIGLLIGSFLNVCIYRIPKEESIAYPPSHCPKCNNQLKPLDLVPLFSYLLNKGKCRYCRETISLQYPIVEFLNGIIYLLLYFKFGLNILFVKYGVLASLLIVISFIDYELKIIPDECNLFGIIISGAFIIFHNFNYTGLKESLLGLLLGGGIFLIIAILTGAMGGGDIKLMGVLGFAFGWKLILLITLLSFVIGAIVSIILLLLKLKNRKDAIAFGPFISVATLITIFYGTEIISWYMSILFG
ncbi:MAG: prepilin peptidase [Anaeromicrobium sp.]|jgi:leader peptidase (prepilin peptidase)/N-methyltransferase|uniref:prepilin peptidase n=1 Tax=Anaeromicrobium sp. TaxID=1929132 RepID=UPI0025E0A3BA|nr:A24 family peptidase [Anaeromicrobium sp.]MCT4595183.1 prepilin peptidase [Anaeromicrobium sp.]